MQNPQYNLEAENSILAACLTTQEAIIEAAPLLRPDDFYTADNRIIYSTILDLFNERQAVDPITVAEKLRGKIEPSKISLIASSFCTSVINGHIQIVKDYAFIRSFLRLAAIYTAKAQSGEYKNISQFRDELAEKILALDNGKTSTIYPIKQLINSVVDDIEARGKRGITGVQTYLDGLDAYLAGIQPSDLMIIAARPSMGKTALGLQIALNNAINRKKVYFVTLEMSKEQLIERMLVNLTGIDGKRLKIGDLKDDEYLTLVNHSARLCGLEMVIDEVSNTVAAIRAQARKLKAVNGLELIVVDYLQIIEGTGESRVEQVTGISRGLKQIAREMKVPVIALSQLNRANESLKEKRPMLSHLRESGAIEQDADQVLFIHREDYYREKSNDPKRDGLAELILAKHRNGPTGIIGCNYNASTMRFYHHWIIEAMALKAQEAR